MNARLVSIAAFAVITSLSSFAMAQEQSRFYCDRTALTSEQRVQMRGFGHTLHEAVQGSRELANGYEFEFKRDPSAYQALVQYIPLEHACCPFFEFNVRVVPNGGALYWSLTGATGIKEFIREELSWLFEREQ
jgi:hypothetical protein